MRFGVGDRVFHDGHGRGTVIEVRAQKGSAHMEYLMSTKGRQGYTVVARLAVPFFYGPERYPYRMCFDRTGYTDVYGDTELSV